MRFDKLRGTQRNYKNIWQGHYFQSCSRRSLFSGGRGKTVTTRCNELQWPTTCYENNAA